MDKFVHTALFFYLVIILYLEVNITMIMTI